MTMQMIEKMELDDTIISILSKENKGGLNIIGVINSEDYYKVTSIKDKIEWKFKYVNLGLDIKSKKILESSIFTTNNNYKLPTFYNRNLIINIYIHNSELILDSKHFISPSIKNNILSALNIDLNKLNSCKLKLK